MSLRDVNAWSGTIEASDSRPTVLCFSHLRWNFVYQRPQHLLTRAATFAKVLYMEEPIEADVIVAEMSVALQSSGVRVLTPLLPRGSSVVDQVTSQRKLLDRFLLSEATSDLIVWYYTPMALAFSDHLEPAVTVYDCMDQLSAFQGAPTGLVKEEFRLFSKADVVFTGGRSLYAAKKQEHGNVHCFPSSIEYAHFAAARAVQVEPEDQASIPHPRIGFFGVLDERFDKELIRDMARQKPEWHFILIGPVVKVREDHLPHAANIHYLGQKKYAELPRYIAHWDVAILPFAQNEATRFISPTKTPEYLAAGKPVVSTPIHDVVEPYGRLGLAKIAADAPQFVRAIESTLSAADPNHLAAADKYLRTTSWNQTFREMWAEILLCKDDKSDEAVEMKELHV